MTTKHTKKTKEEEKNLSEERRRPQRQAERKEIEGFIFTTKHAKETK